MTLGVAFPLDRPRKRTSPAKAARMPAPSLRRTESYIDLRPLQRYRDHREPRRRASRFAGPAAPRAAIRQLTHHAAKPVPRPTPYKPRQTSPLAPTRALLPSRPLFPRSTPEPDLYRKALRTSMKRSPEGQKILSMGPRLAVSMMSATIELERLVESAAREDFDADEEGDTVVREAAPWAANDVDCAP